MPKVTKAAPAPSTHRTAPYPASTNASLPPSTNDQRPPVSAWNASDDDQLMLARAQGLNWQPIATTYFPSKTANACRKRHERLMERRNAENWDGIKVEELAKAYLEVREEMWKILASKVGEGKWTVVEEKCMEKGLKNLRSAGRNAQRRSKPDPSGSGNNSDHDDLDDSGIGGMEPEPPNENEPSGSGAPMQPKGHCSSSPRSSSGPAYKPSTHKTSKYTYNPTSSSASTAPSSLPTSQSPFRPNFEMPSIASILQSVSVGSF
ncbi:hypothetical protein MMC08_001360 [Hypocenomyce scalaris]|nr:hypothetical protein [Hypocenomyce scalaris]